MTLTPNPSRTDMTRLPISSLLFFSTSGFRENPRLPRPYVFLIISNMDEVTNLFFAWLTSATKTLNARMEMIFVCFNDQHGPFEHLFRFQEKNKWNSNQIWAITESGSTLDRACSHDSLNVIVCFRIHTSICRIIARAPTDMEVIGLLRPGWLRWGGLWNFFRLDLGLLKVNTPDTVATQTKLARIFNHRPPTRIRRCFTEPWRPNANSSLGPRCLLVTRRHDLFCVDVFIHRQNWKRSTYNPPTHVHKNIFNDRVLLWCVCKSYNFLSAVTTCETADL